MDYDALGRPTILWGNEVVAFAGMGYYAHGAPAGRSLANSATSEWGYDAIQRLNGVLQNAAGTSADLFLSLSYNPASQIRSQSIDNESYAWTGHYAVNRAYTTNGLNQYTAAGGPAIGYDANGSLISDGANAFSYDIENRLVSVSGAHNAALAYDPLGRLFQLTASGITTTFLYDGDALVAEYQGATLKRRYAHWAGSDVPLLSFTDSDFNSPSYLHTDQQGSIVMLSSSGTPIINRYDEYGIPAATNVGRFQYTGQAWLAELGLYYYKARIYSPTLGRFLQVDPIGYADQFNLHAYVGDDPVNRTDPTGTLRACIPLGPSRSPLECSPGTMYAQQASASPARARRGRRRDPTGGDNHLTLAEANAHYRDGTGTPVDVDARRLTVTIARVPTRAGQTVPSTVNGTGDWVVHGSVNVTLQRDGSYRMVDGMYDFDVQRGRSMFRNLGTVIAERIATNFGGAGRPFLIRYHGSPRVLIEEEGHFDFCTAHPGAC